MLVVGFLFIVHFVAGAAATAATIELDVLDEHIAELSKQLPHKPSTRIEQRQAETPAVESKSGSAKVRNSFVRVALD